MNDAIVDHNRLLYNRDIFVGRGAELNETKKEWIDKPERHLLVVHGPPATGKSWFIGRLGDKLRHNPEPAPVFLIDLRDLVAEAPPLIGLCTLDESHSTTWLTNFIHTHRSTIPTLSDYDPLKDLSTNVELMAEALSKHFAGQTIYVLIDNGDLLTRSYWRRFERTVIEPFHSVDSRFRFVVALRDETQIQLAGSFKSYPLRISAGPSFDGDAQLIKLITGHPRWTVKRLKRFLPDYDWKHPGLNYFLYVRRVIENKGRVSRAVLLREGLNDVLHATLDLSPKEVTELHGWLKSLAGTDRVWGEADLIDHWPTETHEEVGRRIESLLSHWLLVSTGQNSDRWCVAEGLSSFIRACK